MGILRFRVYALSSSGRVQGLGLGSKVRKLLGTLMFMIGFMQCHHRHHRRCRVINAIVTATIVLMETVFLHCRDDRRHQLFNTHTDEPRVKTQNPQ